MHSISNKEIFLGGVAALLVVVSASLFIRLQLTSDVHQSGKYSGVANGADWTVDITQDEVVVDVLGQNGASVRLEAINGNQRDVLTRLLHPDLGRYAISIRIIDSQGIPWIMGMDDIPTSWQQDYQRSFAIDVDLKKRAASAALLANAKAALDGIPVTNFHALDLLKGFLRQQ